MPDYLLQEDGSRIVLEDGSVSLLLDLSNGSLGLGATITATTRSLDPARWTESLEPVNTTREVTG